MKKKKSIFANAMARQFVNKGNADFVDIRGDEYVDKSMLIDFVNRTLATERRYTCVTRARRFGKSMAARMLCAYYDKSCDSSGIFDGLEISAEPSYRQHLNKYPVIYLDISQFTSTCRRDITRVVDVLEQSLVSDLQDAWPEIARAQEEPLVSYLLDIVQHTGERFMMIIDEWDAICREASDHPELMRSYVDLLRSLFKSGSSNRIFAGVYMTGILPIIQYDTQSALNNFQEYTMTSPAGAASFFGFTEEEVETLAAKYGADVEQLRQWYDGYKLGNENSIYNPYSVMNALTRGKVQSYWTSTGAYESLKRYITMNFDGLKDDVLRMMAGGSAKVDVTSFSRDLRVIDSRDAVLTVLIHLGYLSYDDATETVSIPNMEIKREFRRTLLSTGWKHVADAVEASDELLRDTIEGRADKVAEAIDNIHQDSASILQYNDENSLACTLTLAYYAAQKDYTMIRELPSGKGFADIVLIPHRNVDKPAIVLELKWDKTADTAIRQIKENRYDGALKEFGNNIVLAGVNYEKKTKKHECFIERLWEGGQKVARKWPEEWPEIKVQIITAVESNPRITIALLEKEVGKGHTTIKKYLKQLQEHGYLRRIGGDNGGHWEVIEGKDEQ